jgi:hypothetical protein
MFRFSGRQIPARPGEQHGESCLVAWRFRRRQRWHTDETGNRVCDRLPTRIEAEGTLATKVHLMERRLGLGAGSEEQEAQTHCAPQRGLIACRRRFCLDGRRAPPRVFLPFHNLRADAALDGITASVTTRRHSQSSMSTRRHIERWRFPSTAAIHVAAKPPGK